MPAMVILKPSSIKVHGPFQQSTGVILRIAGVLLTESHSFRWVVHPFPQQAHHFVPNRFIHPFRFLICHALPLCIIEIPTARRPVKKEHPRRLAISTAGGECSRTQEQPIVSYYHGYNRRCPLPVFGVALFRIRSMRVGARCSRRSATIQRRPEPSRGEVAILTPPHMGQPYER